MARTIKRQPLSVSTNYPAPQFFNQGEFKGLCDQKNDITVDQNTFSDVKNVYVNESGVLVSRPPFRRNGDVTGIINEWRFGVYHLRLYRENYREKYQENNVDKYVDKYHFRLKCESHTCDDYIWDIPKAYIDADLVPKVSCTPIDDKIFVWFAGIDFIAFNTATESFEDAIKYVYLPVTKTVTNGIDSENEAENFLTDAHIRRHLYSPLSQVDFSSLAGKDVSVYSNSDYLYDITVQKDTDKILMRPQAHIGRRGTYHVDVVETDSGKIVYLRYHYTYKTIEISFDGKSYKHLPDIDRVDTYDYDTSYPSLTRDGLYVIVFTNRRIAKCKIATSESTDVADDVFVWDYEKYPFSDNYVWLKSSAVGYFETVDTFAYLFEGSNVKAIITQWSNGANGFCKHVHFIYNYDNRVSARSGFTSTTQSTALDWEYISAKSMKITYVQAPPSGTLPSQAYVAILPSGADIGEKGKDYTQSPTTLIYSLTTEDFSCAYVCYSKIQGVTGTLLTNTFLEDSPSPSDISLSYYDSEDKRYVCVRATEQGYVPGADYNFYVKYEKNLTSKSFAFEEMTVKTYKEGYTNYRKLGDDDSYATDEYIYLNGNYLYLPNNDKINGKIKQPLFFGKNKTIYRIDEKLWTNELSSTTQFELDETINVDNNKISFTDAVPNWHITMNEQYFAFETDESLLEVTSAKYDERKLLSENKFETLLYLSRRNEQKFVNEITNIHPLSNTEIGVFTEDEIWYVTSITDDSGKVSYSRPIKSKIPFGCRKGSSVITALDGQAIIFPTQRGITALAPQDFIATTEKTLSYLSDNIQAKYEQFYSESVFNATSGIKEYKPSIKSIAHKYWIMFYKQLDKEILLLDTRNGTWWTLTTPYPILSLSTGLNLNALFFVDYLPTKSKPSLLGVPFVSNDSEKYADDVIADTINGDYEKITDNPFNDERLVLKRASSLIDWKFSSQKLHLGHINNYKAIKGITLNLKGDDTMTAKLSTKAYRDTYHPEKSDVVEIKINEVRTFINRLNLLHVINFVYTIENDTDVDMQHKFELNSLGIKYEVKERIR